MMIFKYKGIERDFLIDGTRCYSLVIENPKFFCKFLHDIIINNEESIS